MLLVLYFKRLGQYHETFCSLVNVLIDFLVSLHMLIIAIIFGAAFFGCLIYGFEKGKLFTSLINLVMNILLKEILNQIQF